MSTYLTGAGHFGVGFTFGFLVMLALYKIKKHSLSVQLYAAFIPFSIGFIACLPYLFIGEETSSPWLNIFFFYDFLHFNKFAITFFGRLHLVFILCGSMYLYILMKYIALVKHCRRFGWRKGV